MVNGVTELYMMKADVLSIFDEIKVCEAYEINGERITDFPYDVYSLEVTPIYTSLRGWSQDLTELSSYEHSPQALKDYVEYLEKQLEVPIRLVSVGPDRSQTLFK
jgi:adenylosuccinate synthase